MIIFDTELEGGLNKIMPINTFKNHKVTYKSKDTMLVNTIWWEKKSDSIFPRISTLPTSLTFPKGSRVVRRKQ